MKNEKNVDTLVSALRKIIAEEKKVERDENGFLAQELTLSAEWYYHALMYSYIGLGMTKSVLTDVLSVPADLSSMIHDNFINSSNNNMIETVQKFHLKLMRELMNKITEETGKDEDEIKKLILKKLANKYFNNWLRKIGGVQPLKVSSTRFKPSIAKRSFIGRF